MFDQGIFYHKTKPGVFHPGSLPLSSPCVCLSGGLEQQLCLLALLRYLQLLLDFKPPITTGFLLCPALPSGKRLLVRHECRHDPFFVVQLSCLHDLHASGDEYVQVFPFEIPPIVQSRYRRIATTKTMTLAHPQVHRRLPPTRSWFSSFYKKEPPFW